MICYDLNSEKEVYQDSTFNTLFENLYANTLLVEHINNIYINYEMVMIKEVWLDMIQRAEDRMKF